jgi:type IV pilus assembly protein PilW
MANQEMKNPTRDKGFTIIELLIAMLVGTLVIAATFIIFKKQQEHYTAQMDVTEMQQNIRFALDMMARDFRMAGYDGLGMSEAEIINAKSDLFHFTVDLNEDGDVTDVEENIAYDWYKSTNGNWVLGRTTSDQSIKIIETPAASGHWEVNGSIPNPRHQAVAENIEHLEFVYLDKNGNVTTTQEQIRTVIITIVARTNNEDPNFRNTQTYTPASNSTRYVKPAQLSGTTWVKDDNFRRRVQILTVESRNVGI